MKVCELFETSVKDAPEFTVDVLKKMRELARKRNLIIDMGSGNVISKDKKVIGYSYHIFSLHPKSGVKLSVDQVKAAIVAFWDDFIAEFGEKYNISSPLAGSFEKSATQPIKSGERAFELIRSSNKLRLTYKSVQADPSVHVKKVETYLNSLLASALMNRFKVASFKFRPDAEAAHAAAKVTAEKGYLKKINDTLASEKENGFTYPDFEKKLDQKRWPDEFRKLQLAAHAHTLKDASSKRKDKYQSTHQSLMRLFKNLEQDEINYGFSHPELKLPKDSRPLIYWQKILKKDHVGTDEVLKNILESFKEAMLSNNKSVKERLVNEVKDKILMAKQAGLDSPDFEKIEKYL